MTEPVPEHLVPSRGRVCERDLWSRPESWDDFPPLELVRATDGSPASNPTQARLVWDPAALHLQVRCRDRDIWSTHLLRDAPLWEEEVVEWFVAPGAEVPSAYAELEWNPLGTLFDAWVDNPDGDRRTMRVDRAWSAAGLRWTVRVDRAAALWTVQVRLPWAAVGLKGPGILRTNVYRIERPVSGAAEFQAWSPTLASPADFHRPARFGKAIPSGT